LYIQPDQNVFVTQSYPPSYLILSNSSSWRSYFCKNIGYVWILRLGDPNLHDLVNLWSYKLIMT